MPNALEIHNLTKTYTTGVQALRGVDLTVAQGDFFALLGPNGAGKTTIINIATGLVNKTDGTVLIEGISIDDDAPRAKLHVGVVPQEFNFGIFDKVLDIVVNQAGYYGIPRKIALPRAKEYLTKLGLGDKLDAKAMTLSGGMKRRLMIARGLVHEPKLLILDEPTAGVDIELRRGMWEFLTDLNSRGTTIILTTHYLEEAEQLCKNVAIINKGEIVSQGSIKTLLAGMEEETFIFDLDRAPDTHMQNALMPYRPKYTEGVTIELIITPKLSINDAVRDLNELGLTVVSLRNKTNRLEEFFMSQTSK